MEIKDAVEEWVRLWNTYDLDEVRRLFLNDGRVSYFSSEKEGLIKGIDALVRHHEEFGFVHGGKETGNRLWLEGVDTEVFGDAAAVKADWLFQRKGTEKAQRGPVTILYVKQGGIWRIAHAHFSNY
ncbi:nuclear transport factor 2 family protein [Candidatus Bathyarchaeota archaeon]|nr:nuclear transport factor 2 family protein [Candidatus Bathyarchaeota archaeon]